MNGSAASAGEAAASGAEASSGSANPASGTETSAGSGQTGAGTEASAGNRPSNLTDPDSFEANDDRFKDRDADVRLPKPLIKILKDGESVYKPGMKTYLAGETTKDGKKDQGIKDSKGLVVAGTICTCNTVCTCNTQRASCSCNSYHSSGGCSCNPVH